VWLGAGRRRDPAGQLRPSPAACRSTPTRPPGNQSAFAAIPYGQLDLRYFILDRWSLNLVPRISAPLAGPRFFNFGGDNGRSARTPPPSSSAPGSECTSDAHHPPTFLCLLALTLAACVFGYRGEAEVTATYPLAGVDASASTSARAR
jgi:hypothetical protein